MPVYNLVWRSYIPLAKEYNPDEERNSRGEWTAGEGIETLSNADIDRWGESNEGSQGITGESAKILGLEGYRPGSEQDARIARAFLNEIASGRTVATRPLYSGHNMSDERLAQFSRGSIVVLPLTATSVDEEEAGEFTTGEPGTGQNGNEVLISFPVGTPMINYGALGGAGADTLERIVAGAFRVEGRTTTKDPYWGTKQTRIRLSYVGSATKKMLRKEYNPDEARNSHGEWTVGGGASASGPRNDNATRVSGISSPKMQAGMVARLAKYGATPESMRANIQAALDNARAAGIKPDWYDKALATSHELGAKYGVDPRMVTGMIAATSPQQEWDANVRSVDYMLDKITSGAKFTVPVGADLSHYPGVEQALGRSFAELTQSDPKLCAMALRAESNSEGVRTSEGHLLQWSCGDKMTMNALAIQQGAAPESTLGGHKVRSFFNNISDPANKSGREDVTIDSHALFVALGQRVGDKGKADLLGGAPSSVADNAKSCYSVIADAYREVAAAQHPPMLASDVQSMTWEYGRKHGL